MLRDIDTQPHHPAIEEIVDILSTRTQNNDRSFFRVMVAYFLGKMAGSQRVMINTKDRGMVPVNIYALSLAVSGAGKGHSVGLIEEHLIGPFQQRFVNETFPMVAETNLLAMAQNRALRKVNGVEQTELDKVHKAFNRLGALAFTFDSGTTPAVKQMRQKLLMADAGAINMQIDEIGSNLIANTEVLNAFLELYDQGRIKQKLTKNTSENERDEELEGKTPTNMLLFGTPSKLLDGGKTEDEFYSFLETGYARRCIFAYGNHVRAAEDMSARDIYFKLIDNSVQSSIDKWAQHFYLLADPAKFKWEVMLEDDEAIELLEYRIQCEALADKLPEHEEIRKAELSHRYFKTLKLAGALAFIDESSVITMDHLYYAMKLVEESGTAFQRIFNREKNYVKLAKYLASVLTEVTHADLNEALPFFKGSAGARNEMMNLAMAWGYKNHIIIKKTFMEGIEFFQGETLEETNLDQMIVSYADHVAYGYLTEPVKWDRLHELTQLQGYHWINHGLLKGEEGAGHRTEENCVPGFNMITIDVDKGTPLSVTRELLKDYTHLIYTTKRHQTEGHGDRYRIILPINYKLELDAEDYREFMSNVFSWLPFEVDAQTNQRARKWETFPGQHFYNEGQLLDALRFIPKTSKNEEYKASVVKLENLDNLERWFAQRMVQGNRNNHMLRFAMALVDTGLTYKQIEDRVLSFNSKLDNKLPVDEIKATVLKTVAQKLSKTP